MERLALVIPVKNEALSIRELIASIRKQSLQPDEIILVDGGSADDTIAKTKEILSNDPRVKIIESGGAMPGQGRNIGAEQTTCEWIAFTDAGIRLDERWLECLVNKTKENAATDIVYGNYAPVTDTFFEKCAAITYVSPPVTWYDTFKVHSVFSF